MKNRVYREKQDLSEKKQDLSEKNRQGLPKKNGDRRLKNIIA